MVERLLPTGLFTMMPPVVMTFVPVRVSVFAPAVLKRRLFGVIAAAGVWLLSTPILRFR